MNTAHTVLTGMAPKLPAEAIEAQLREVARAQRGSTPYTNARPIRVTAPFDNKTVEELVVGRCPHVPLERWQEAEKVGQVIVNERVSTLHDTVKAGESVSLLMPGYVEPEINPDIKVLYYDEEVIAFLKPAPLPVHPCGRYNRNSLVNIWREAFPESNLRLAHRLDASTTGMLVATLSRSAAGVVQPQFESRSVTKDYLALVSGLPSYETTTIDASIDERPRLKARRGVSETGRSAKTEFEVLHRDDKLETTLLRCRPISGRTNQIRIHCYHQGLPIIGDPAYCDNPNTEIAMVDSEMELHLHAWMIEFTHPSGERLKLTAPPPDWAAKRLPGQSSS